MTCRIIDAGTDWRCLTHDVQVEPTLPDAYTSNPVPSDYYCPVAEKE